MNFNEIKVTLLCISCSTILFSCTSQQINDEASKVESVQAVMEPTVVSNTASLPVEVASSQKEVENAEPPTAEVPVMLEPSLPDPLVVQFEFDSAEIKPSARREIIEFTEQLQISAKNLPNAATIIVDGYTDTSGPESYNLVLSQQRSEAVEKVLSQLGVNREFIDSKGLGEENPIADNNEQAGRQKNRRVEIVVQRNASKTAEAEAVVETSDI